MDQASATPPAAGGALRDSEGKPRYDLIPPEFLEALAVHLSEGCKKYSDRNWERGMDWGQCYRALMSHATKWAKGETFDDDPKLPGYNAHHMIAAAWNAMALYVYHARGIGNDNRVVVSSSPSNQFVPHPASPGGVGVGWASPTHLADKLR